MALKKGFLSLINRKRIRGLLEPIAALVELQTVFCNGPHGSVLNLIQGQSDYLHYTDGTVMDVTGSFSGQVGCANVDSPLHEGCRLLHHRALPLVAPKQHRQRIGISTIQLGKQIFISGINFFPHEELNEAGLIGYHIPASEKWVEIPPTSRLVAIRVAFCSQGLTGIKFVFDELHSSDWIGDISSPGIALGTLKILKNSDLPYLVAGLDHFKVASLSIGKLTHSTDSTCLSRGVPDFPPSHSYLWAPYPPNVDEIDIGNFIPARPLRAFEPLVNVDFGGPRGLFLSTLTRLTFYMRSAPNPILGVEVFYANQSPLLLGVRGGCEISFFINGPQGERIDQLSVFEESEAIKSGTTLNNLQVSTNYSRTATFSPLEYRLGASIELKPVSPPGNTITGLAFIRTKCDRRQMRIKSNQIYRFRRFAVQSQKCDEQPTTPEMLDPERHRTPDDQLRYDERFTHFIGGSESGNHQTYASLKNVRRIQASTGIQGRSRSPNHISGLKIEYHDHPSPGVVGQWMSGLDNVFEISSDEDIRSLSVWLAPAGSFVRGLKLSQVAAICLETTQSRSVTFCPPGWQGHLDDTSHYRYQKESDEDLTAISWVLNTQSDRVRAVISPKENQSPPILVPEQHPPFDQTQKLYFALGAESLVMAEVYFRSGRIVGLLFGYSMGSTASIGDSDTGTRQTVHFESHPQIVGLSVTGDVRGLMRIDFQVESNGQILFKKVGSAADLTYGLAGAGPVKDEWQDAWSTDAVSTRKDMKSKRSSDDRLYEAPTRSRLVGIYAGSQVFSRFGALYQPT